MYSMKKLESKVKETTTYENLVGEVPESTTKLPPTSLNKSQDYPFKLMVHCWTLGDTEKFALKIRRTLRSDDKKFTYTDASRTKPENWKYIETRKQPYSKPINHVERIESKSWVDTLEFHQDGWKSYITFTITFRSEDQYVKFARRVKQRLSLNTKSINFPERKQRKWKYKWVSKWENPNPVYPIYIVSKGRADSRLTSKCFERIGVPYYIVIEPQDYDAYSCMIDESKILVLPFSNHGDGPGRARNWCWDHSISLGYKRHWVCDDNITDFARLYRNKIYPVSDGGIFRVAEEFVDRFENVPVSGFNYSFYAFDKTPYSPFVLNTRIYSVLLIENSCPHRWRGRYNEDTILSLDLLKDGYCTIQFNAFLQNKVNTQVLGGGNTAEFYADEGTYNKSIMLEKIHPDVAKVVWMYGRWHHHVDYSSFKSNPLKYIQGYDPENNRTETDKFVMERVKI